VACVTTDTADDVCGKVALFGAVVLAVSDLATVLACLVLVVTESTVESGELTELVALELVLAFGDGSGRLNDVVNQLLGLVDLVFGVGHNKTMQVFFLVAGVCGVGAALSFLDGALASDGNLCTRLCFHLFQGVATRTNE
jgi:uncharacterized membrane protein YuzA (DUF378 family)